MTRRAPSKCPAVSRDADASLSKRRPRGGLLAVALTLAVRHVAAAPAAVETPTTRIDSPPTFTKAVAPILFKNCVRCHRTDGAAANVPLVSYDAVRRKVKELRDLVARRRMPPWPADSAHSLPFRNDPRLSQEDIDTLVAWADAGAPMGNDSDLIPAPEFSGGWLHPAGRAPDAVISLPQFTVIPNGTIPYIQRLIKVPYARDRWISALQVRAGNPELLHHMGITEVELPDGVTPEMLEGFDEYARQVGAPSGRLQIQHPAVVDASNPGAHDMLAVYTPGTTFETYGEGNGKLLKGGKNLYINFNVHYTTTGTQETDRTQLALWFAHSAPKNVLYRLPFAVDSMIVNGRQLLYDDSGTKAEGTNFALPPIPANDDHYEVVGVSAYREAITIYQLQPHAHVRAKDFKYVAVYPDGKELTLLSVPDYSYHFQLAYELATPLTLPAGSKLIVTGHYDNSIRNEQLKHLGSNEAARKCGPENVAYFGRQNQSWDEMFSPLAQYSIAESAGSGLRLVSAVGCLVRSGAAAGWILSRAGKVFATAGQGSSSTEIAAASGLPLGTGSYRLIGVEEFDPLNILNSKVVVKGVMIPAPGRPRINVTSLQATSSSCVN